MIYMWNGVIFLNDKDKMSKMITPEMLNMISNMSEEQLRQNLQKVSQVLGNNTTPDMLLQKLKDANIVKKNN